MLGAGLGKAMGSGMRLPCLFTGGAIGGLLGVALAVLLAARVGAILRCRIQSWSAFAGGTAGFALAVIIVPRHLHSPLIPIACTLLPGIGAALAARMADKRSSGV
jgi:hypothetical protein